MEKSKEDNINEEKQEELKTQNSNENEENTSDASLDNIKKELEGVKKELDETDDRYKRVMAEFENYKKRNAKERESMYDSILADVISAILPAVDNLEKAVTVKTEDTQYKQGVELVVKQLQNIFTTLNVKEIETVGKTFDPELHEAVSHVEDETLGEKEITLEYRKGYKIGNKVIRHSMVVVAN